MGLIKGSGGFTRFTVNGAPPPDYLEKYTEQISHFAFTTLDEYSDEERATGWVNIMNIFDCQFLDRNFFKHPYITLTWRLDIRKVPQKALNQHCFEAEEEIKHEEDIEFLHKKHRKEIKEMMWRKLLKRAIPNSYTYDMVWNLESSTVIFGGTGDKVCDEFSECFTKTFDLTLSPVFPYSLAFSLLEKEMLNTGLLDALRPIDFIGEAQ